MFTKRLKRNFYTRPTLQVARDFLGKYIIRRVNNRIIEGKIIETEAYIGPYDKASHSYKGKITKKNKVEYLEGGYIYIYLVYGMYWQLNVVTAKIGMPECVLIRALDKGNLTNGPGKVCCYLKLDGSFYGQDLTNNDKIWLEDRNVKINPSKIIKTPRIGIDYAGAYWSKRKWRFIVSE